MNCCPCCGCLIGHYVGCMILRREQIGTAADVPVSAGGETLANPPPSKPTDADVEHLRRAMVDAHQTWLTLLSLSSADLGDDGYSVSAAASDAHREAARAYVAAKRARLVPPKISEEARAARAPRPPEELVGALQDRAHRESGAMRAAKSARGGA